MAFALDLLLLFAIFSSSCQNSQAKITYADHCGTIVPQSPFSTISSAKNITIHFSNGYFTGGENLFSPPSSSSSSKIKLPGKVDFYLYEIYSTNDPNIYHLSGHLYILGQSKHSNHMASNHKDLRRHVTYTYGSSINANFELFGFWSQSTGKLCMVGTGTSWSSHGKYLKRSIMYTMDIYNNNLIARGMIKSVDTESSKHFDTVSVVGYHKSKDYVYTKITAIKAMCALLKVPTESLGFENHDISTYLRYLMTPFRLEYGKHRITSLFSSSKTKFMTLHSIETSEDGKVTMLISFSNSSYYVYDKSIEPGMSLVGEGYWDSNKKLLCVLACRLQQNLTISECTIGLSFRFPSVFTVKDRANVFGRIWSTKGEKEPGYFTDISLKSIGDSNIGFIPGVKYEYTKLGSVKKNCEEKNLTLALSGGRYPNGNAIADLNFDLSVKTKANRTMIGYAVPLSLDDAFFGDSFLRITTDVSFLETKNYVNHSSYNVSYLIKYSSSTEKDSTVDISAEGIYNSVSGKFCMVGCKSPSHNSDDDSQDCEIQINIQLSPYYIYTNNTGIRHLINGTIISNRKTKDPRYFEALELSSYMMYESEYRSVAERMDMEIVLVMISLTLSCIFIVMQIFYVRKHKNVLPSISMIMLVILITSHVIPLLLNLEAMFVNRRRSRSVMLWSGGWVEVNGVVVRVLTLVAFLLQLRLLQITWDTSKDQKFREVKVMKFLLPFYFGGALISWLVQRRTFSAQHVISYCGLIFDGFLIPQILSNFVVDSKEKALTPVFYMGTTAVRVLPHLYDAYRTQYDVPYLKFSYIYASKDGDFFSSIWDFIIPLGGILFAVLVFLQQKYGGACLIPLRFRKNVGYETVPVINL